MLVEAELGPQPFEYKFLRRSRKTSLNAFAAPAGHIYVHTGALIAGGTTT